MAPARPLSFVQQLEKAPRGNVILASIGISLTTAGFFWAIMMSRGEKVPTLSDEWRSANKEFMKFQKMNPIFGISKGL